MKMHTTIYRPGLTHCQMYRLYWRIRDRHSQIRLSLHTVKCTNLVFNHSGIKYVFRYLHTACKYIASRPGVNRTLGLVPVIWSYLLNILGRIRQLQKFGRNLHHRKQEGTDISTAEMFLHILYSNCFRSSKFFRQTTIHKIIANISSLAWTLTQHWYHHRVETITTKHDFQ